MGERQVGLTGGPPRYGAGMTAVDHPGPASHADAWIASGAAALAGWDGGPGLVPPPGVLARIARLGACGGADPWATMTERAAVAGLRRRGRTSCGGGTRLLRAADGWLAVSLVRPDDVAAVPAWLEIDLDPAPDPWPELVREVGRRPTAPLVAQAVLLGMPVAAVGERFAPGATGEGAAALVPAAGQTTGPATSPAAPLTRTARCPAGGPISGPRPDVRDPHRWSWTSRRCGRARCAPGSWGTGGRRSSRSSRPNGPTAPGVVRPPSSTVSTAASVPWRWRSRRPRAAGISATC